MNDSKKKCLADMVAGFLIGSECKPESRLSLDALVDKNGTFIVWVDGACHVIYTADEAKELLRKQEESVNIMRPAFSELDALMSEGNS